MTKEDLIRFLEKQLKLWEKTEETASEIADFQAVSDLSQRIIDITAILAQQFDN